MKKIILATSNNASFKQSLEFSGAEFEEIRAFPESFTEFERFSSRGDVLLVCEINNRNVNDVISLFQKYAHHLFDHFCIYPEFDGSLRIPLIESGVCDISTTDDFQFAARCLRAIFFSEKRPTRGTIHLMSDASTFLHLLGNVARRFHYDVKHVSSTEQLIHLSEKEISDLVLVDMDTIGFDSIEFAKKTSASSSIKKAPLIFYKDMRSGLFVHDFNPALQRLAKVILSREELLNLLLALFFLSGITSPAHVFTAFLQRADLSGAKRLREIFYAGGPDLCYRGNIFSQECFGALAKAGENIINLIERIEPLRWLVSPLSKRPTCAGGV